MKIFAINLAKCVDRRAHLERECARYQLEPEIVPAVDGRELSEAEFRAQVFQPGHNALTRGEIGCALSHLRVYRRMLEEKVPVALVLEDDIQFLADPRPLLAGLEAVEPERAEVYLLSRCSALYARRSVVQIGGRSFYETFDAASAYGYVLTLQAARRLAAFIPPIRLVADYWKRFLQNRAVDKIWLCGQPAIQSEVDGLGSLLAPERVKAVTTRERKLFNRRIRLATPLLKRWRYFLRWSRAKLFLDLARLDGAGATGGEILGGGDR